MEVKTKKTFFTTLQMRNALIQIEDQMVHDAWMPSIILGINRGGCIPGVYLSHRLDKPHEVLDIRIPPGVKQNDVVKYQGYGDKTMKEFPRGDLIVSIQIKGHPSFNRDGDNIYTKVLVDALDLLTGCNKKINTPEGGSINLKIPNGTNPGTVFSVNGYGAPNVNNKIKGNLFIEVGCTMTKLTE